MFRRYIKKLRRRSVSLSGKILVLVVAAVIVSLSLAGFLIYGILRARTYEDASETLLRVASTASIEFDAASLKDLRKPADHLLPAYKQAKDALLLIWKQNHFDQQGKWGRLSLLRLSRGRGDLTYVVSLQGDSLIGTAAPKSPLIYEAAVKGEPMVQDEEDRNDAWLRAYAPLRGVRSTGNEEMIFLCAETNVARIQWDLFKIMGNIVLASLAGLLIAVAGGYLLTQQITKPLRAFVDVMKLMQSTGDFDMRIDLHPEDEDMSVVEDTFESLINKVRESRRKEEGSYWSTLQALVSALDVRDNETAGHSVRVTRYSLAIAERMRLNDTLREQLRQGSLLHDIGKIGVPDAILRKSGKLTDSEWKEMQRHPVIGKSFLDEIEFLRPATAVVYCHHERWDGKGYPSGLQGEAIPVAARIFAVADALDTITSERYYKKARSFSEARAEIERCAGTHFDPSVVKTFLTLPEKTFLRIRLDTSTAVMELDQARRKN
jgi:HD-GYP domain-containing protein (c-di-GMP phosphodiesterase class II)